MIEKQRINENIHSACETCGREAEDCTCDGCICGHCVERDCSCLARTPALAAPTAVTDVDPMDQLVAGASVLNLGSLFKQAKTKGLISSATSGQAYT